MSSPQGPQPGQDSSGRPAATDLAPGGWAPADGPASPFADATRSSDVTRSADGSPTADAPRPGQASRTAGASPSAQAPQREGGPPPRQPARPERQGSDRQGPGGDTAPTTVLPGGVRRPPQRPEVRPGSARTTTPRSTPAVEGRSQGGARRARLALQRIDPWSVFLYSLVSSVFLGIALVVAVFVLYSVLGRLGVPDTINELYVELTGGDAAATPLLSAGRFVGGAVVLAALNVVLLTLLATLSALLYNLCASFTGGIEVTLGERD